METLNIKTYPDPWLRKRAEEVNETDNSISGLIKDMFAAMEEGDGIGLAAPQIGISKRVIVVSLKENNFEKLALINPFIIHLSDEKDIMEEGCLSVPGVNAEVERPNKAVVGGTTKNGRQIEITAHDLLARVLQHEIDHLNGVLFIDRLKSKEKKRISKELETLEKSSSAIIR